MFFIIFMFFFNILETYTLKYFLEIYLGRQELLPPLEIFQGVSVGNKSQKLIKFLRKWAWWAWKLNFLRGPLTGLQQATIIKNLLKNFHEKIQIHKKGAYFERFFSILIGQTNFLYIHFFALFCWPYESLVFN